MIGSKDNNRILIQSQVFQSLQDLAESTVYSRHRRKIITDRLCLLHFQIHVRTIQRFATVKVEILFLAIIQRTIRTVRRIHTYHNEERFLCIAYIPFISQIRNDLARFMQRRPLLRIMSFTIRIPIMRILMFVESSIRIPVIKTMTTVFRCIGVPYRTLSLYILSRMFGIVRSREVSMELAEIRTIITSFAEYVTNTFRIFTQ